MICEGGKSRLYRIGLEYYINKERAGEKGTAMDIQVKEFNGRRYKIYNICKVWAS